MREFNDTSDRYHKFRFRKKADRIVGPSEPILPGVSDENGIVSFEIDRPVGKWAVLVSSAKGFGFMQFEGVPDEILDVMLQPSIFVKGQLSLLNTEGELKPAAFVPIYMQLDKALQRQRAQIAVTDASGRYNVYLPRTEGYFAELFVEQFNSINKQAWQVGLSADSEVDFAADIP